MRRVCAVFACLALLGCETSKVDAVALRAPVSASSIIFDKDGNTSLQAPTGEPLTYTNVDAEGNAENVGGHVALRQVVARFPQNDVDPVLLTISAPDDLTIGTFEFNVVEDTITINDLGATTSVVVQALNEGREAAVEATIQNAITQGHIREVDADMWRDIIGGAIDAAAGIINPASTIGNDPPVGPPDP